MDTSEVQEISVEGMMNNKKLKELKRILFHLH